MSLALIMKNFHAVLGVNRMKNGAITAAPVKLKCYSFTTIMYYVKTILLVSHPLTLLKNNFLQETIEKDILLHI